jgi:lysyl-tRNA synthetase class 2
MDECEALVLHVSASLGRGQRIRYQGREIRLEAPFERISLREAFDRYAPSSLDEALRQGTFDETVAGFVEPHLGFPRPTFVYDYPAAQAALARAKPGQPELSERFEFYLGGLEIANAFSELKDAGEQRRRFMEVLERRRHEGQTVYPMPERFLKDLARMPDAAGIAVGIDRLAMVFADAPRIDDIVAFVPEEL